MMERRGNDGRAAGRPAERRECRREQGGCRKAACPCGHGKVMHGNECGKACDAMWSYQAAIDEGAKPEDARYLLPEATKTSLVMTINARSLQNLFTLRLDAHAQWEIRELAATIERELKCRCDGQWPELIGILREARND